MKYPLSLFNFLQHYFLRLDSVCVYLCLLMMLPNPSYAEVIASTSQQSYYEGDVITLTISSNQNHKAEPDLTPLEALFDVRETSTNSQISIVNGHRSYQRTWNIELLAKQSGQLIIPKINVGNESSDTVAISIDKLPPEVAAETKKHIFVEASADIQNAEIYVQQQIPYTVKFYYDSAMQRGEVVLPTLPTANIRVVGNEKKYQVVRAGKKYVVVERHYVISPEKSGELLIPPTLVQGRMAVTNGNSAHLRKRRSQADVLNELFFESNNPSSFFNPFDPFFSQRSVGPTRPYKVSSEAISVNVLPVPKAFTGKAWLPAEDVIMKDSWAQSPPTLKVGEPVTRTIVMQVKGLASSQIPDLLIPKTQGMKVYPEKAKTDTPNDGNTVYGIQGMEITYIPDQVGAVSIPEINVDWWDVNNKVQKTFTLPAWDLQVSASDLATDDKGAVNNTLANGANDEQAQQQQAIDQAVDDSDTLGVAGTEASGDTNSKATWKVLAVITALALFLLFLWGISRLLKSKSLSNHKLLVQRRNKRTEKRIHRDLLLACNTNDNKAAAEHLIKYAAFIHKAAGMANNDVQNLGQVAKQLEQGSDLVSQLERSLYAPDARSSAQSWNGQALAKLVAQGLVWKSLPLSQSAQQQRSVLAPLYPTLE